MKVEGHERMGDSELSPNEFIAQNMLKSVREQLNELCWNKWNLQAYAGIYWVPDTTPLWIPWILGSGGPSSGGRAANALGAKKFV